MNERLLFWGIYSHRLSRIRVPRGKLRVSFELWIKMARRVVPPAISFVSQFSERIREGHKKPGRREATGPRYPNRLDTSTPGGRRASTIL